MSPDRVPGSCQAMLLFQAIYLDGQLARGGENQSIGGRNPAVPEEQPLQERQRKCRSLPRPCHKSQVPDLKSFLAVGSLGKENLHHQ